MNPKLSFQRWLVESESIISTTLANARENDWKEDVISAFWMRALRDALPCVEITDLGRPYAMAWDALKLKRKQETPYGDIGVFVRIDYPNGARIEGVGFIEAKRFYPEFRRYDKLDRDQLKRMVKNIQNHRLGLYTQTPIPEAVHGLRGHGVNWVYDEGAKTVDPAWNSVLAVVVPSTVALQLHGKKPSDLHPASLPLSYQLCARYLGGYDLETQADIVDEVRGGGAGSPSFLLISHVVIGGETEPSTNDGLGLMTPGGPYSALEPVEIQQMQTEVIAAPAEEETEEAHLVVTNAGHRPASTPEIYRTAKAPMEATQFDSISNQDSV